MREFSFERLDAYQLARKLVKEVYALTGKFPNNETYGLSAQLQRAIVSVASNLAEGSGRVSIKEKIHFLEISFGSAMEAYCQLQLAVDLEYVRREDFDGLKPDFHTLTRMLNGLKQTFTAQLQPKPNPNPITS